MTNNVYNSIMDIYDVCLKYDGVSDKSKGNEESIRILLKYDVISEESVKKLNEKGKLKINNIDEILSEKKGTIKMIKYLKNEEDFLDLTANGCVLVDSFAEWWSM